MLPDSTESRNSLANLIDDCLLDTADYLLEIDRDSNDDYVISFDKRASLSNQLTRNQVMKIIPMGSHWSYFLGLRDIFGIPLPADNPKWIAFGFETALKHKTRGAYLYLKALLLPLPLSLKTLQGIEKLASDICRSNNTSVIPRLHRLELNTRRRTIVRFPRCKASHYAPIESWIIRRANYEYSVGKSAVFRTLAMKKSQLSDRGSPSIMATLEPVIQSDGFYL